MCDQIQSTRTHAVPQCRIMHEALHHLTLQRGSTMQVCTPEGCSDNSSSSHPKIPCPECTMQHPLSIGISFCSTPCPAQHRCIMCDIHNVLTSHYPPMAVGNPFYLPVLSRRLVVSESSSAIWLQRTRLSHHVQYLHWCKCGPGQHIYKSEMD